MSNKTLLTDLYQLTMDAAYRDNGIDNTATFELFIRKLPPGWGYFIAAGIEEAIDYATSIKVDKEDISKLEKTGKLPQEFIESLSDLRFEGDIYAVKEGTPVFPNEPLLRVTAKRSQAQLLESALLNIINYQTMIATKANRVVNAADGAGIIDFGLRRAQGEDAAMKGARAAYVGGAIGTSNVKAGLEYSIPIFGTHAHSFVMSFPTELEAFRAYTKTFPDNATLLIDTYDTVEGAKNAAIVAKELAAKGHKLGAVRLDSGDLAELSHKVRAVLNKEGLYGVKITATNDLNEVKIDELRRRSAPIDSYGVGTELITAKPVAAIPGVYKIVEDEAGAKIKLSPGKESNPGKHQVYRILDRDLCSSHDIIALDGEKVAVAELIGTPLLSLAVKDGVRVRPSPSLEEIRAYALDEVSKLPYRIRGVHSCDTYSVGKSDGLIALANRLKAEHTYTPEELAQAYA